MWPVPCCLFRDRTGWDSQYSKWGGGLCISCISSSICASCPLVHQSISSLSPSIHPPTFLSQLSESLSQSSVNFSCLSFVHLVHWSTGPSCPSVYPSICPHFSLNYQSLSLNHPSISLVYLSVSLSLYAQALLAHISTSSMPCQMPQGSGHISCHPSPFSKGPGRPGRIAFLSHQCIYPNMCRRSNAHMYPSLPCPA